MNPKQNPPLVISVAAVSGGGKTTVTKCLSERLPQCKALFFDDYDFDGPDDICEWVESGADYNAWNLSPLIEDLEALREEPLNYIVLDFPFAYAHRQASEFMDVAIFIDTPLDVAMARRLLRDFASSTVEEVMSDMTNYLHRGRRAYLTMLDTIKPQSDIGVDGTLSVSELVNVIMKHVEAIDTSFMC